VVGEGIVGAEGRDDPDTLDLAVIGAGAAGTYVAERAQQAHADWSITLFERTERVGGRLWSMPVPGLDHPIELGGMRYMTSHRHVRQVVDRFGLATHPFDPTDGVERTFLRGRFGDGIKDPAAGDGYALRDDERGRSALDLVSTAFDRIVPGASALTADDWARVRATHRYLGRPVTDWSIADALLTVMSADAYRFFADSFGYDSGPRAFNVADGIQYIVGGGDPRGEARVPDAGMDAIPKAMAAAFSAAGGTVRMGHELVGIAGRDGVQRLRFANGVDVIARRVVLATSIPSLQRIADGSPVLGTESFRSILGSVEAFPAVKVYLWYDRPWWSDMRGAMRMTTDLPSRKLAYFGSDPHRPAAVLAAYTDGRETEPWRRLLDGSVAAGSPPPAPLLAEVERNLRLIHPTVDVPVPVGAAISSWGSDPTETGWTFWRPGFVSDDVMRAAIRPVAGAPVFVCGEAFSRAQAWAEGALETADAVVDALA
jgi:monoamine oxidase